MKLIDMTQNDILTSFHTFLVHVEQFGPSLDGSDGFYMGYWAYTSV
jgi:hypothetical protein